MKRLIAALMGAVFALFVLAVSATNSQAATEVATVTEFDIMAPVKGAFLGAAHPVRGVPGAGLPWTIGSVSGHLKADGSLLIDVRGLVLADDPMVPAEKRLTNPVANFMGIVSCKSMDMLGKVVTVNTSTDQFPATMEGDSKIEAMLHLPYPCVAPVVFVTTPEGYWLAVSGR